MAVMVLNKNFYTFARTILLSDSSVNGQEHTASNGFADNVCPIGKIIEYDGSISEINAFFGARTGSSGYYSKYASLCCFSNNNSNSDGYTFFSIGSGNSEATSEDYELEEKLTKGFTISLSSNHYLNNNLGFCEYNIGIAATNDIVINEIGLNKCIYASSPASTEAKKQFLIGRCVLNSPITVNGGDSITFKIIISF